MIVVADASVLVAELVRKRGRALLARPDVRIVVAKEQWDETGYELGKRLDAMTRQGRLTEDQATDLLASIAELVSSGAIEVIDRQFYAHNELIARRRVPRDPHDWPPVALAMTLQAGILTGDHDFLGCGCPTWTVETLREELDAP